MSSIRLFILGSLAQHGEMHGHQLRLLAEEEHVHLWTDVTVGSLYGAIKRLAIEGLIDVVRVEREGNFPERQVYAISEAGREALTSIRFEQLTAVAIKHDPFDLALTRLDGERLDAVPHLLERRLEALETMLVETEVSHARALPHLTLSETFAMGHRAHRIRAEIEWQRTLLDAMPDVIADERRRNEGGRAPLPTEHPEHADHPALPEYDDLDDPPAAERPAPEHHAPSTTPPPNLSDTPILLPRKASTHV